MENCPLNGMPCPYVKNINIIEIGPNKQTSKNLCICCGIAYLGSALFKSMEPTCSCGHTIQDMAFTGRVVSALRLLRPKAEHLHQPASASPSSPTIKGLATVSFASLTHFATKHLRCRGFRLRR